MSSFIRIKREGLCGKTIKAEGRGEEGRERGGGI